MFHLLLQCPRESSSERMWSTAAQPAPCTWQVTWWNEHHYAWPQGENRATHVSGSGFWICQVPLFYLCLYVTQGNSIPLFSLSQCAAKRSSWILLKKASKRNVQCVSGSLPLCHTMKYHNRTRMWWWSMCHHPHFHPCPFSSIIVKIA